MAGRWSRVFYWPLALTALLFTPPALAANGETVVMTAKNGITVSQAANWKKCARRVSFYVDSHDPRFFQGDRRDLQKIVGGVRAVTAMNCKALKTLDIYGRVGKQIVYRGTTASNQRWQLVSLSDRRTTAKKPTPAPKATPKRSRTNSTASASQQTIILQNKKIQVVLKAFKCYSGKIDGVLGAQTTRAVKCIQKKAKVRATGRLDAKLRKTLVGIYDKQVNKKNKTDNKPGQSSAQAGTPAPNAKDTAAIAKADKQFFDMLAKTDTRSGTDSNTGANRKSNSTQKTALKTPAAASLPKIPPAPVPKLGALCQGKTVNWRKNPRLAAAGDQMCSLRAGVLDDMDAREKAQPGLSGQSARNECESFAADLAPFIKSLGQWRPEEAERSLTDAFADVPKSAVEAYRICLGIGYLTNKPQISTAAALSLIGAGEAGFAEVIAGHMAFGFGMNRDETRAADWYEWTGERLSQGAKTAAAKGREKRASLMWTAAKELRSVFTFGNSTGQNPKAFTSQQARDHYSYVKMSKDLEQVLGLSASQLQAYCRSGAEAKPQQTAREPAVVAQNQVFWRLCRAVAYRTGDFSSVQAFDSRLANGGE